MTKSTHVLHIRLFIKSATTCLAVPSHVDETPVIISGYLLSIYTNFSVKSIPKSKLSLTNSKPLFFSLKLTKKRNLFPAGPLTGQDLTLHATDAEPSRNQDATAK